MGIKWVFYRDSSSHFRWEVQGEAGPIATGGKRFESLDACVGDARDRGYDGQGAPAVSMEPSLPGRDDKPDRTHRRPPETVKK